MYTSSVPDGRAANHASFVVTLRPPIAASLPGARVSRSVISCPASVVARTCSGDSAASVAFSSRVAAASTRAYQDCPNRPTRSAWCWLGDFPVVARISEASSAGTMPSLSVVHTVPSVRRKDAPADSSPPNPTAPSISPGTNHLNPTGTSSSRRPRSATTRSIREDETTVLPTAVPAGHPGRPPPYR